MNKINFYIIDDNKTYADKLSNYIFNQYSNSFIIKTYYSENKINDLLKKNQIKKEDIIVVDKKIYNRLKKNNKFNFIIISKEPINSEINKFLPGSIIINQIIKKYKNSEFISANIEFKNISKEALTIGFYSPIGGIGVTSLALLSSIISSEKDLKTLFISFEMNTSLNMILKKDSNLNMSKFFYYLLSDKSTLIEKFNNNNFSKYNDLYYIFPFESILDYNDISEKNILTFIELIKENTDFDRIIIDIPSTIDNKILGIFRKVNKFIFVSGRKPSDYYKVMNFKKEYDILENKNIVNNNSILVLNKYRKNEFLDEKDLNPFNLDIIKIPWFNDFLKYDNGNYIFNIKNELRYALELVVDRL